MKFKIDEEDVNLIAFIINTHEGKAVSKIVKKYGYNKNDREVLLVKIVRGADKISKVFKGKGKKEIKNKLNELEIKAVKEACLSLLEEYFTVSD